MIFAVLDDLARVAAATAAQEQGELPTPCEGFDVRGLRVHLTGGLAYFEAAFRDPSGGNDGADPHEYAGLDALDVVLPQLIATLRKAWDGGVADEIVNVPHIGGSFPGRQVADLLLIETITHGWDLARATGQSWEPAEETSEHALAVFRGVIQPSFRGPGLPFGPEFPIAPDAPALDRMLAFVGRDPGWTRA
jgi:uncharacterized protein (TIGR03086 family)